MYLTAQMSKSGWSEPQSAPVPGVTPMEYLLMSLRAKFGPVSGGMPMLRERRSWPQALKIIAEGLGRLENHVLLL
jgi:hypothetical protein